MMKGAGFALASAWNGDTFPQLCLSASGRRRPSVRIACYYLEGQRL